MHSVENKAREVQQPLLAFYAFSLHAPFRRYPTVASLAMSELGLTYQQTRVLLSFQYHLTLADVMGESSKLRQVEKRAWLSSWEASVEHFLETQEHDADNPPTLYTDCSALRLAAGSLRANLLMTRTPVYLILLECTSFRPYYQLDETKSARLRIISRKAIDAYLMDVAAQLGIDPAYVGRFQASLRRATDGVSGRKTKVLISSLVGIALASLTAGLAAPAIAAALAPAGLYGAAAISAGLATLGGGAIAAGGLGMAGGIAVIVGGGALLGASSGAGLGALLSASSDFALLQAAKLEVVLREIVLSAQKDTRIAQELIKEQRNAIVILEQQLFEMRQMQQASQKEIRELRKSIDYLRKSASRNENCLIERKP